MKYKIAFETIAWNTIALGAEQKVYQANDKQIRLLKLEDNFVEPHWCNKGHIGYILQGKMSLNFDGNQIDYHVGDALFIVKGDANKHKVIIEQGEFVEILLVEDIKKE